MTNKAAEPGNVENPPQILAVSPYTGTSMRPKQGPLVLPEPGETIRQWPVLRGNPEINAELDRLLSSELSSTDRGDGAPS